MQVADNVEEPFVAQGIGQGFPGKAGRLAGWPWGENHGFGEPSVFQDEYLYIWCFPKIVVPQNGWFIVYTGKSD